MAPESPKHDSSHREARPWYREPWPWFVIGLLGAAITASLVTVWLAVTNPDLLVVEDAEYQLIRSEMRANVPAQATTEEEDAQAQADHDDG